MVQYNEREYISKKGFDCVESSVFGKCKILTQAYCLNEFDENECWAKCDSIPESKFHFYVDTEMVKYYASRKEENK